MFALNVIIAVGIIALPFLFGFIFYAFSFNINASHAFEEIARKKGITVTRHGVFKRPAIDAVIGGARLTMRTRFSVFKDSVVFCLSMNKKLPYGLRIEKNILFTDGDNRDSTRCKTGDSIFDEAVYFSVRHTAGAACFFNEKLRILLVKIAGMAEWFLTEDDNIRVGMAYVRQPALEKMFRLILELRPLLEAKRSIIEELIQNALHDSYRGVRQKNLDFLILYYPDDPKTKETAEKTFGLPGWEIKYAAAQFLGKAGFMKLYERLHEAPDDIKMKIIRRMNENRWIVKVGPLLSFLRMTVVVPIQLELIGILGQTASTRACRTLIDLLGHDDYEIRKSAVKALASCGTIDAVVPLNAVARKLMENPFLRAAAKRSIALIRKKYGVKEGWLSLTGSRTLDGSLSMTDEAAEGGMSLSDDDIK
ncbi:MAG: HEAT repeat domain-containing protein [Spirochaetales bacterium]|nr:HEAT repeat domain-containing protein [Spirochaetales bacterium]